LRVQRRTNKNKCQREGCHKGDYAASPFHGD
jgi:hypothetical protein